VLLRSIVRLPVTEMTAVLTSEREINGDADAESDSTGVMLTLADEEPETLVEPVTWGDCVLANEALAVMDRRPEDVIAGVGDLTGVTVVIPFTLAEVVNEMVAVTVMVAEAVVENDTVGEDEPDDVADDDDEVVRVAPGESEGFTAVPDGLEDRAAETLKKFDELADAEDDCVAASVADADMVAVTDTVLDAVLDPSLPLEAVIETAGDDDVEKVKVPDAEAVSVPDPEAVAALDSVPVADSDGSADSEKNDADADLDRCAELVELGEAELARVEDIVDDAEGQRVTLGEGEGVCEASTDGEMSVDELSDDDEEALGEEESDALALPEISDVPEGETVRVTAAGVDEPQADTDLVPATLGVRDVCAVVLPVRETVELADTVLDTLLHAEM
jgi:hypothetical protein